MCSIIERKTAGGKKMALREELAKRLRGAREIAGLGQAEVAEELDLPRSAVSKMENGEQRVESVVLARMARLYGVSASSLLAVEDEAVSSRGGAPAEALLRSAGDVSPGDRGVLDEFLAMCRDYADLRGALAGDGHGR